MDSEIFIPPTTYISYAKIFLLFKKTASQSIFLASKSCSACDAIGVQYLDLLLKDGYSEEEISRVMDQALAKTRFKQNQIV